MRLAALVAVLAPIAGFGVGWIANDQLGSRTRTTVVQHRRDTTPTSFPGERPLPEGCWPGEPCDPSAP